MIKELISRNHVLYRYARLAAAAVRLLDRNFAAIRRVPRSHIQKPNRHRTVVLAGLVGLNPDMLIQTLLGLALQRSGANVLQFSCDSAIKLCFNSKSFHYTEGATMQSLIGDGQGRICDLCRFKSHRYAVSAQFRNDWMGRQLIDEDWSTYSKIETLLRHQTNPEMLRAFTFQGLRLGEHAYTATVRFFASPALQLEKYGVAVFREYLLGAVVSALGFQRFLDKHTADLVVVDHGIYVPQGVIVEIAKKRGIRVLTFNTGYRKSTFLFAEGDSYHFAIPRSKEFAERTYTENQRKVALDYVKSRISGRSDWVHFQPQPAARELYFDQSKTHVAIFPNVLWDADVHFEEGIFASSLEWLEKTLEFLGNNSNVIVHLRIHPGEKKGAVVSRYSVSDFLRENQIESTPNLIIYDAENDINSYELAEMCDYSIVFGSKIGIDLAALGHRVLTAGDCWTRDKGVTTDPATPQEYFRLLEAPNLISSSRARGLDFAYYLYFEKMYLFDFVTKRSGDPPFSFDQNKFERSLMDEQSDINRLIGTILS